MKKIFQLFLAIALVFAISACTSKKVEDQTDDATVEMTGDEMVDGEVSEEDFADGESTETATTEEATGEIAESTESAEATESAPVDEGAAIDESTLAESTDAAPETEMPAEETPTDSSDMEGLAASTEETPVETPSEMPSEYSSETPADTSDTTLTDSAPMYEEPAPAPAMVPLRKIEATPWTQGNILLNAVYLARQGDDFNSVSQKIYGSEDRVSELKKLNPTIAKRAVKVGDKIYYNSPKRPTDNTQLLTFYEDNGLVPETYVSQPGDNIRTVAKNLLGHDRSWMEVWATNLDVESKGELAEGTRLRYWAGDVAAAPAPVVAEQQVPPPIPEEQQMPAAGSVAEVPPPPTEPPPPMPEDPMQAQAPPPPPVEETLPPEPVIAEAPPAPTDAGMAAMPEESGNPVADLLGGEDQTTALMIGALFLIAAAALFIIIKKRKSKKNIDFQTATHTQIE